MSLLQRIVSIKIVHNFQEQYKFETLEHPIYLTRTTLVCRCYFKTTNYYNSNEIILCASVLL